ncbi:MAG: hypothetical protein NTW30_06105 [Candidatus Aenigmarchaeota archaeon]|nr:hypothetical protein [Candidatus Aenigmarchaeota archaeon]
MTTLSERLLNDARINGVFNPEFPAEPPKAINNFSDGTPAESVGSGQSTDRASMVDGYWQSANYVPNVSGWRIDALGNVEFGSGKFRGNISGATGTFGNLKLNDPTNTIIVNDGTNDRVLIGYLAGKF